MKKLLWLFFLLPGIGWAIDQTPDFSIKDFSAGMYSYPSANEIPDNAASYIQNFFTDIQPGLVEKNGSIIADVTVMGNTNPVTGLWTFADTSGIEWQIAFSSRTFYKRQVGGTFTAFGSTQSIGTIPNATVNLGKIWFSNGTDKLWYFDGSTTNTSTTAPKGTLITSWRNRIVIAGVSGAQSSLYFSADGDGTNWTLGGGDSDPFITPVAGNNDGYPVTCLSPGLYADTLIVGRKFDLWGLNGFTQSDYQIRKISSEVGCIQQGTMREFDGSLMFLSARGLEEMSGSTIKFVSEPVRDLTDVLVKNTVNQRSNTQSSQADWQAGVVSSGSLSATSSPGDLAAPTTNWFQTTANDFMQGTFPVGSVYVDTLTSSGQLRTIFPDVFTTLRTGLAGTSLVWSTSTTGVAASNTNIFVDTTGLNSALLTTNSTFGGGADNRITTQSTFPFSSYGSTVQFSITRLDLETEAGDPNYTQIFQFGIGSNYTASFKQKTAGYYCMVGDSFVGASISSYCTSSLPVTYSASITPNRYTVTFGTMTGTGVVNLGAGYDGVHFTFDHILTWSVSKPAKSFVVAIDSFTVAPEYITYTSTSVDTGITTPVWDKFYDSHTGSGTLTYQTQVATSATAAFDAAVSVSSGSAPTSLPKEFVVVVSSFQKTDLSTTPLSLDYIQVGAYSTGTFTSQILSIGNSITAWGPVTIDDTKTGGSILYQFNSDTNSSVALFLSTNWVTITNGGVPTNRVAPYAAFRMNPMLATTGTSTVKTSDFITTWTEGSSPAPISFIWDRRYWLSFTTSTTSSPYLDSVLVYQRNRTFTLLKGINCGSFSRWRDGLYFGDSSGLSGQVYQYDIGNNDAGNSITSVLKTKSYDLGYPYRDKDFRKMYTGYFGNSSFSGNFSLSYDIDRSGNAYSLGTANLSDGTGQIAAKFPFPLSSGPLQGREIQYTLTKSGTGDTLKLYEFRTFFTLKEEP